MPPPPPPPPPPGGGEQEEEEEGRAERLPQTIMPSPPLGVGRRLWLLLRLLWWL